MLIFRSCRKQEERGLQRLLGIKSSKKLASSVASSSANLASSHSPCQAFASPANAKSTMEAKFKSSCRQSNFVNQTNACNQKTHPRDPTTFTALCLSRVGRPPPPLTSAGAFVAEKTPGIMPITAILGQGGRATWHCGGNDATCKS